MGPTNLPKTTSTYLCNVIKGLFINDVTQPGPASTEVEHSLRKIFVPGDRGSILAEETTFQTRSFCISHKFLAEPPTIGQATITQPWSERAVATSLCMIKEPTNWPYDVILEKWNDVILLYYAILQPTLATYDNNSSQT